MARRAKTPEAPAPEGFWEEFKAYHGQLWQATEDSHRRGLLRLSTYAVDEWLRQDPEDAKLGIGTRWRGRQFIGGTVLGTLNVSRMRVADATQITEMAESDAPVENTYYRYLIPNEGSRKDPAIAVSRRLYTPRDLLQSPPPYMVARVEAVELWSGLQAPDADGYQRVLNELAVGASGQFRVQPPPEQP